MLYFVICLTHVLVGEPVATSPEHVLGYAGAVYQPYMTDDWQLAGLACRLQRRYR
jgi:hypothetical protein